MVCSIKEMQGSELQSMYFLQIHPQLADGHVSELFVPILQPRSQLLKLSHQFASLQATSVLRFQDVANYSATGPVAQAQVNAVAVHDGPLQ
jgi:hypothetical protein